MGWVGGFGAMPLRSRGHGGPWVTAREGHSKWSEPTQPSLAGPSDPTAVRAVVKEREIRQQNSPVIPPSHSIRRDMRLITGEPCPLYCSLTACPPSSTHPPLSHQDAALYSIRVPQVHDALIRRRQVTKDRESRSSPSGCVFPTLTHHQDAAEDAHCTPPDRVRHASTSTHAPCCSV